MHSEMRWWIRWEMYHQILMQFGDVTPFLEKHDEIAPTMRSKLLELFCMIAERVSARQLIPVHFSAIRTYVRGVTLRNVTLRNVTLRHAL